MSVSTTVDEIIYPDSDGQPMADNSLQYEWMSTLKWNAEAYFRNDPNIFVAGDHLVYPQQGDPTIRLAPDVYVAFGRPKGHRGSYKVWEENNLFPQVVIEVFSPNNTMEQMEAKRQFYEHYGAEEYYIVYPDFPILVQGWQRQEDELVPIETMNGYTSPRLGFRFEWNPKELRVYGPDGRLLLRPDEIAAERDQAEADRDLAEAERKRAETERDQAKQASQHIQSERDEALLKAAKLAEKLRQMGIDPDQV